MRKFEFNVGDEVLFRRWDDTYGKNTIVKIEKRNEGVDLLHFEKAIPIWRENSIPSNKCINLTTVKKKIAEKEAETDVKYSFCADVKYSFCAECGEIFPIDDMQEHNGFFYCEDCFDEIFTLCDNCGSYEFRHKGIWTCDTGRFFCDDCKSVLYYCNDCEEYFENEHNVVWNFENDCYYCEDCANYHNDDDEDDEIDEYHTSKNYGDIEFFGGEDDGNTLFMGMEIEVDKGHDRNNCAYEIKECMGRNFITMEYDGSLNNGFENITQPATLEYHKSIKCNYAEMHKIATSYGFKSHDTSTCGFHIHFNRSFFDKEDEQIAKLLYITEKFWDELVKFSRRSYDRLEQWAKKYEENPEEIVKKMKDNRLTRYYAINLTNTNTIEFRMFRGTLNENTIIATLSLVDTMVRLCKEKTNEELQNLNFTDLLISDELKDYWETVKNR